MASYCAIAELYKEIGLQLSNYINICKITFNSDSWFNEDLWIEQPGSKIPKIIQECAKISHFDGYNYFLLTLVQKLNEIDKKEKISDLDFYTLAVFGKVASIFPPFVDENNIPVLLTQILFHPVFKKCPESIFRRYENLVIKSEKIGNNIFPAINMRFQKKITSEEFFPRIKLAIGSSSVFLSFIDFIPTLEEKMKSLDEDAFFKSLYAVLHYFSINHPGEHKKALISVKNKSQTNLLDMFDRLLKNAKNKYAHWPLISFLLPFCIKSYESTEGKSRKILKFITEISSVKSKKANFNAGVLAVVELMFYHQCLGKDVSQLVLEPIIAAEKTIFTYFTKRNEHILNLLPIVAVFQSSLSGGKQNDFLEDCLNYEEAGSNACHLIFKDYPVPFRSLSRPKKIGTFMLNKSIEGKDEIILLLAKAPEYEVSLCFSTPDFVIVPIPTKPALEIFIDTLMNLDNLVKYVQVTLSLIYNGKGNSLAYELLRNIFLPHDEWIKSTTISSSSLLIASLTIGDNYYKIFLYMYRHSLYNVTQIADSFLSFIIWIYFVGKSRKDEIWINGIQELTLKLFDVTIILKTFGFIGDCLLSKVEKGISEIASFANLSIPEKPSVECQNILLTLPFTLAFNPVSCFSIAFRYAPVTNDLMTNIFQVIKLNSAIAKTFDYSLVESFTWIQNDAAPIAENILKDILETQILSRSFQEVEYISILARAAYNIANVTEKANIASRREILSDFLRIIICANYGSKINDLVINAAEYCTLIFSDDCPETHVDAGVLRLLLQVMSMYLEKGDKKTEVINALIEAVGAILGCSNLPHSISSITRVNLSDYQIFKETNDLIYASVSVLNQAFCSVQEKEAINKSLICALQRLLKKNFKESIGICFQAMTEKSSEFQRAIITALASVFNPTKMNQSVSIKKVGENNYRIQANSVDVTFDDLLFNNTISFKASLSFLSYFGIHMEYFKYIMMNEDNVKKSQQGIFMQAFFDFCFTTEELQSIYDQYVSCDVYALFRLISANTNVVKAYQVLRDGFSKYFTDNFLRKFLKEPSSYDRSIEKGEYYPIGSFMQSIKLATNIDQMLDDASKSISGTPQFIKDFNTSYSNFIEFCSANSMFDRMNVYGENILSEQLVEMRNANFFIYLGTGSDGIEKYVMFLDRYNPEWKAPTLIYRFVEMHFTNCNPSDILIDCTNTLISKEVLGQMFKKLKKLHITIAKIHLFNPSDDICDILESAITPDEFVLFRVINIDNVNNIYNGIKIPYSHILEQNSSNFIFKTDDRTIVIGDECIAILKDRVFFEKRIVSAQYLSLSEKTEVINSTCLRAAELKNEYRSKHCSDNAKVIPFDANFIFAEIIVALCNPFPPTQSAIFSIIQNATRGTNSTHKFMFSSGTFVAPLLIGAHTSIDFFPHLLQKLLESYPDSVQEFYNVIVQCLNMLTPNLVQFVAQTMASFKDFGKSVAYKIAYPEVAERIAVRLLELNALDQVIPLIRRDTCSYILAAASSNTPIYSLTLARALSEVLFIDDKVATTDELLAFCVEASSNCLKANFGEFSKLAAIVHLLCFKDQQRSDKIRIITKNSSEFVELVLSNSVQSELFCSKPKTPFYLFCRSFYKVRPSLFDEFMEWAKRTSDAKISNGQSLIEDIEYSVALLERIISENSDHVKSIFALALVASTSKDNRTRLISMKIISKCFKLPKHLYEGIPSFVASPEIQKSIQMASETAYCDDDGFMLIISVLLPRFMESATSKLAIEIPRSSLVDEHPALLLPIVAFTQDSVDYEKIPVTCQAAMFLRTAFCDRRAYNQIARVSKALCTIIDKNWEAVESEYNCLTSLGIEYLTREVNPVAYESISYLISKLISAKKSTMRKQIKILQNGTFYNFQRRTTNSSLTEKSLFALINVLSINKE